MGSTRADPFAGDDALGDLSDFAPKPNPKPRPAVDTKAVREVAEQAGFRSREQRKEPAPAPAARAPRPRGRPRSDRTEQLNMKLRRETFERFVRLADAHKLLYGDLLDRAMDALEEKEKIR